MITEIIRCHGHKNVLAHHKSTFEITKETDLSLKGDCIIGVCADRGAVDLSEEFKKALQNPKAELETKLLCGGKEYIIHSKGGEGLLLTHETDFVWRKSDFMCSRTIGIASDFAARDLPRELIADLQNGAEMTVILTVQP